MSNKQNDELREGIREGVYSHPEAIDTLIEDEPHCPHCQGTGMIEVMGDGDGFEWDGSGYKHCNCEVN